MDRLYQKIAKDAGKIAGIKPTELFKDTPQLANLSEKIANLKKEFANLKVDPNQITEPLNRIKAITTNTKAKGLVDAILGANAKGDFETVLTKAKGMPSSSFTVYFSPFVSIVSLPFKNVVAQKTVTS